MIRKSIASILIIIILINVVGCSSYQQVLLETDADQEIVLMPDEETLRKSEKVIITTLDDKTHELTNVKIQGLIFKGAEWISASKFQEVVISAEEIKKIEVMGYDGGLTFLAIIIIVGAPILIFAVIMESDR